MLAYLEVGEKRMRCGNFHAVGMVAGSSAVATGRKPLIYPCLNLSRTRWGLPEATPITSLRCNEAGGRWNDTWRWLYTQAILA